MTDEQAMKYVVDALKARHIANDRFATVRNSPERREIANAFLKAIVIIEDAQKERSKS